MYYSVDGKWETSKSVYLEPNVLNHFVQTFWVWIHFHFSGVNGPIFVLSWAGTMSRCDTLCSTDNGEFQDTTPYKSREQTTVVCSIIYYVAHRVGELNVLLI